MSYSKPVPSFMYDLLRFLNRDQLEQLSIICRPLKNFIDRYYHSKPYRVFDELIIRPGLCFMRHNGIEWHPNQDDYSVQQFLAGHRFHINHEYYSFAKMRPYLGPTIRISRSMVYISGDSTYSEEHVTEMESMAHLWHHSDIYILPLRIPYRTSAEHFQLILNSPTILQCQTLSMYYAQFSFKDYKVLYTVKVIETYCYAENFDPDDWSQFLEQPGIKPVVDFRHLRLESANNLLDRLSKAFYAAVLPNAFRIVITHLQLSLTEFRESNKISREILELKRQRPESNNYTLERYSV